jgi:hypothetical protein
MRSRLLISTVAGLFFSVTAAVAQEAAKPGAQLPNLTGRLTGVHFFVSEGRIQAVASEAGVEREQSTELGAVRHEKLTVSTNADQDASIEYELTTAAEQLSVGIVDGQQVTVSRRPTKDSSGAEVEFSQPRDGPLKLSVASGGIVHEASGLTLWHLLLAEPELCRRHLLPLLEMFRADWRLMETAQSIESQMLRTAQAYDPENLQRWGVLVADLASDRFTVRQAADRQLRSGGPAVLPYLQSLDHRRLDFEQWSRIRHIIESQEYGDEDLPDGVAGRLMGDRRLWLIFLDRPEESSRRIAAQQMGFLLGGPIKFDPAAPQKIRQNQLEAIQRQVEIDSAAESGNQ